MAVLVGVAAPTSDARPSAVAWPGGLAVVGYRSPAALRAALTRFPGTVVRRLPALKVAEVRPRGSVSAFAAGVAELPGIAYVERLAPRSAAAEPAILPNPVPGGAYEWQYRATRANAIPASILRAAAAITIAVVDTGADLSAPDLAAKSPAAYSVATDASDVRDSAGHGTFVASLAAGSVTNGEGIAGFGGDAKLLVVQASSSVGGDFTDLEEAKAIVYAVDHGARIVNLSFGGPATSLTEQNAVQYAVDHGVLVVAAAGNGSNDGNPVDYPAALLQPVGSKGQGGSGLSVAASTLSRKRAAFSKPGSYISLAAPGEQVFGALSSTAAARAAAVPLPGSAAGLYGYGSGTSFATPQVAGAAALVWATNPLLNAQQVAAILKETASGKGMWNEQLGFGVIDVARAVARASNGAVTPVGISLAGRRAGSAVRLSWRGQGAARYRLSLREDDRSPRVLLRSTRHTRAAFRLRFGHMYSFTVAALDAAGAELATSAPFTVSLPQSRSALALRPSRRNAFSSRVVRLRGRLVARVPAVSPARRTVLIEVFDGNRWREIARTATSRTGSAAWSFSLERGRHRLRALFLGADDLAAATSRPVVVRV